MIWILAILVYYLIGMEYVNHLVKQYSGFATIHVSVKAVTALIWPIAFIIRVVIEFFTVHED